MRLWAVIPSRNRREMLEKLVAQLSADGVRIVVVDNGYEPSYDSDDGIVSIVRDPQDPPNLSRLWNIGLDWARYHHERGIAENMIDADEDYLVAVLNDDLVVPSKFVQQLAAVVEETGAAAVYPDQHGVCVGASMKFTTAEPISLCYRLCGFAFALRGSANIRADESLQWWYGDDDIDWTARSRGGSVLVGGLRVEHLRPNETTVGALAEQAGRDRQTFIDKWGRAPW